MVCTYSPQIARCIVVALLFAQSTMVGMMILKGTYMEIYFLGLIILATCVYFWYIAKLYEPLASQLPFDMATALDLDQQNDPDELAGAEEYIQVRALACTASVPLHGLSRKPFRMPTARGHWPLDVARSRGLCLTASCHSVRPLPVPLSPMHPATYRTCVQPSLREGVMRPEVEFDHGGDLGLGPAGHKSGYSDVSSSSSSVPLTTMGPVADDDAII